MDTRDHGFTICAMPLWSTVCWLGTDKASILNRISHTWLHTWDTRTSTPHWCISPSPKSCCSMQEKSIAGLARLRWAIRQEVSDETAISAQLVARILSWLAGRAAQRLSAHSNLISRYLAFVPPLRSRQQTPTSRQTSDDRSHGDGC